jgi:hypothetical protein
VIVTDLPASAPPAQVVLQVATASNGEAAAGATVGHQQLFALAALPLDEVVPPVTALVAPSFTVAVAAAQALLLATMPLSAAAQNRSLRRTAVPNAI